MIVIFLCFNLNSNFAYAETKSNNSHLLEFIYDMFDKLVTSGEMIENLKTENQKLKNQLQELVPSKPKYDANKREIIKIPGFVKAVKSNFGIWVITKEYIELRNSKTLEPIVRHEVPNVKDIVQINKYYAYLILSDDNHVSRIYRTNIYMKTNLNTIIKGYKTTTTSLNGNKIAKLVITNYDKLIASTGSRLYYIDGNTLEILDSMGGPVIDFVVTSDRRFYVLQNDRILIGEYGYSPSKYYINTYDHYTIPSKKSSLNSGRQNLVFKKMIMSKFDNRTFFMYTDETIMKMTIGGHNTFKIIDYDNDSECDRPSTTMEIKLADGEIISNTTTFDIESIKVYDSDLNTLSYSNSQVQPELDTYFGNRSIILTEDGTIIIFCEYYN